jgi:hypothetical protein
VFVDEIAFCHRIDLRHRLTLSPRTLTPADLLLAKLQIVEITAGDLDDLIALFIAHDLAASDIGAINAPYIVRLLADDWGFYFTVTSNLAKLRDAVIQSPYAAPDQVAHVVQRIDALRDQIEREPKSTRWKIRARVGTRFSWYNQVEEHQRAL